MSNNPTSEQMDALLTFFEEHRDLALGHLKNVEGRNQSRQLWVKLTDELNALGGCTKSTRQWQKFWTDKKYLTKKAAGAARRSAAATGGGPSSAARLTARELRIISLMGEGYGEPETDARVPAFPENPQEQVQVVEDKRIQPAVSPAPPPPAPDPQQQQQRLAVPNDEPHQHRGSALKRRRSRRSGVTTSGLDQSVRSRLFRMEEERVAADTQQAQELSLIRQALQDICTVMQDILIELRSQQHP